MAAAFRRLLLLLHMVAVVAAEQVQSVVMPLFLRGPLERAEKVFGRTLQELPFNEVVSKAFVEGAGDPSAFEATGTLLLEARDWAFAMGAGLAFNLSALVLNFLLYRSRLVPRWLSVWGFLGAALWMIVWFPQIYDIELGVLEVAFLPIALQEMVFAVYLIVRGFDPSVLDAVTSSPAQDV